VTEGNVTQSRRKPGNFNKKLMELPSLEQGLFIQLTTEAGQIPPRN